MRYEELTIEGRNAVLEAYRAGKTIDKLFVLDGCQDGPVRTIAECVFTGPQGQAVIRYTFPKNDSAIGVHIRLITAAKNTMFKYSLETALQDAALYGKAPFGLDTLRSDGLECTAQDYALLHDGTHALSVSNTGTYALSACVPSCSSA